MNINTNTNSNTNAHTTTLNQFTKVHILKEIGRGRLTRFFDRFDSELTAAEIPWPRYDAKDDD